MKILEAIKASLKKSGIDVKYADRIQKLFKIENEEGIDDFVALFKDNVLPEIQAIETDTRKTAVDAYEKTHGLKDGKPVETPPINPPASTNPEISALTKQIETLTGLVSGVVKSQGNAAKLSDVKAKMKGKIDDKYIDKFAGRVNLDAEDLDAEIENQITEFSDFKQSLIADLVGEDYKPAGGSGAPEKSVEEWAKIMDVENTQSGTVDLGLGK